MGTHRDNEPGSGKNSVISSLISGETRKFALKHMRAGHRIAFDLADSSLLVMAGDLQDHWRHRLPKTKVIIGPRIMLICRKIISSEDKAL